MAGRHLSALFAFVVAGSSGGFDLCTPTGRVTGIDGCDRHPDHARHLVVSSCTSAGMSVISSALDLLRGEEDGGWMRRVVFIIVITA